MTVPASTYVSGGLGALFLLRGVWNAKRSVVGSGKIGACAGPDGKGVCHSTMVITAKTGTGVYSTGKGKVVSVGPDWVHVALSNEPVVLFYDGVTPHVAVGDHLWNGQRLGEASNTVAFGVYQRTASGLVALEPASWLSARGYKASSSGGGGALWCEAGRHMVVPKSAHQTCGLKNPMSAGFSLLPVSVEQE